MLPDQGRQQLPLQEDLCDLRLGARRRLGRAFALAREGVLASTRENETVYLPVVDVKDDFVYVVMATRGSRATRP